MSYTRKELPDNALALREGFTYYMPPGVRAFLRSIDVKCSEDAECVRGARDDEDVTIITRNNRTNVVTTRVEHREAQQAVLKTWVDGKQSLFHFDLEAAIEFSRRTGQIEPITAIDELVRNQYRHRQVGSHLHINHKLRAQRSGKSYTATSTKVLSVDELMALDADI